MVKMMDTLINNKWHILLPEHRHDRPEWDWWEQERLQSMHDTTKPGDIVYYVGSEEGDMCGLLAMWGAKLVLFEPNDKVWPNTKAIWDANKLEKPLGFVNGFASDETKNGEAVILDWPDSAKGEIIHDHGFKELKAEDPEIPQISIDDLVASGKVPPPDMISLDVEGAEGRVLRGAEQTLRKYHPKIYLSMHYEFLYRQYNELYFDLQDWIKSLGYVHQYLGNQPHEQHELYTAN